MERDLSVIEYNDLSGGIKLSSNPFSLQINESPYLINTDLSSKGIFARKGYEFAHEFPEWFNIVEIFDYHYENEYHWIAVSYPHVIKINPKNYSWEILYSKWYSDGKPEADQSPTTIMLVDGVNKPIQITGDTVVEVDWPQTLLNPNNDAGASGDLGNIQQSVYNVRTEQQPADFGMPNHVLYVNNRFQVTETVYRNVVLYSMWSDFTDFSTNDPAAFDIAFYIELPTPYPVTGWSRLNNEIVVIYLTNGYIIQSGTQPPGIGYPEPLMSWQVRDTINGCLNSRLIQQNSQGDNFYITARNRLFSLGSSQNFNQAQTDGLSEDIYPLLENFSQEQWEKSVMVNNHTTGELLIFAPIEEHDGYATTCFVYKYSSENKGWTPETLWGDDFRLTTAHLNLESGKVIIINQGNRVLLHGKGNKFDDNPVATIAELRPEDFGNAAEMHEVIAVFFIISNSSENRFIYRYRWDNNEEAYSDINTEKQTTIEDIKDIKVIQNNILSDVGTNFKVVGVSLKNRNGQVLKQRIETNREQSLEINKMIIVFERNGVAPINKN